MRVAVIGAGSWGLALAQVLSRAGCAVTLWARDPAVALQLAEARRHPSLLPGITLEDDVCVDADLAAATRGAGVVMLTVPSHAMAAIARATAAAAPRTVLVSAAKGFEARSGRRMTEVIHGEAVAAGVAAPRVAALSGPNIAIEVARGQPAATVLATADAEIAATVRDGCNGGSLRFYSSDDVVGVEYGGALKNVVAIGAGICDGIGIGDNGKAAFITRGIAEIARLGTAAGARPLTFAGLTGLGDCIVTCMSPHSRNRGLGEAIGRGQSPEQALAAATMVVEGVNATRAAMLLAGRLGVDMPIASAIHDVLFGGKPVGEAVINLLTRDAGHELRGFAPDS